MDDPGCDNGPEALIDQLLEGAEEWTLRESTFESLASEADRLDRLGDGCSVEIEALLSALRTAAVLARSCRLACAAILAGFD